MFDLFKKKEKPKPAITIRDTLFGDLPFSEWPRGEDAKADPWISFIRARKFWDQGNKASAIAILQEITGMQGLESRHYLQAWHFLRQLGVNPPAEQAKLVYGVVVEVGMKSGADILATYLDHTARYLNYTGAGVIWEHPDTSLDAEMEALLRAGQAVANQIGPWDQARPAAPVNDYVRLNMLTPSGLHFGYGTFENLAKEPMGKAIIDPATQLMVPLTKK